MKQPNPTATRQAVLEAFEPRILFAADASVLGWAASGGISGVAESPLVQIVEPSSWMPAGADPWAQIAQVHGGGPGAAAANPVRELVVLDLSLPDAEVLLAGLQAQRDAGRPIEILTLQPQDDGLALIGETLDQHRDLQALHLLTHGGPGQVQLGSRILDEGTLAIHAADLARWSLAFVGGSDWMIYGCDVAQGAAGQRFVQQLALLTGADVAASDDDTGALAAGGDWSLEVQTGPVQTALAADAAVQQRWQGLMATQPLGAQFTVNTTTDKNQNTMGQRQGSQTAVARASNGNFVVVWTSDGQDGDRRGIYARLFSPTGSALSGEIQVNAQTANHQQFARVAMADNGNFVVTWTSDNQDGNNQGVYARVFDDEGTPLTGDIQVNSTTADAQGNSVIAINRITGEFVVAWEGNGAGDDTGIFFRRFSAAGAALDAQEQRVNTNTAGEQINPALAMLTDGGFVIAWESAGQILFQRFAAVGTSLGQNTLADASNLRFAGPALAADTAGNFTVVAAGSTANPGIYLRSFGPDGVARSALTALSNTRGADHASVSAAADGSFLVTWRESNRDTDDRDIFAQAVSSAGEPLNVPFVVNTHTSQDQASPSASMWDANHYVVVWGGNGPGDKNAVSARVYAPPPTAPTINTTGTNDASDNVYRLTAEENQRDVGTLTATDPNLPAQTLTWRIVGGADAAKFELNPSTGVLRFNDAPNAESPADADENNVYQLQVRVSDGTLDSPTQDVVVRVLSVADSPIAIDDYLTVAPGGSTQVNPVLNDIVRSPGGTARLLDVSGTVAGGTVTGTGTGSSVLSYQPRLGAQANDTDRFMYLLDDGQQGFEHYWRLDGDVQDLVGALNGYTVGTVSTAPSLWNQSLQFSSDGRAVIPDVALGSGYTLGFWFKLDTAHTSGYQVLLQYGAPDSGGMLRIERAGATGVAAGEENRLITTLRSEDGTVTRRLISEFASPPSAQRLGFYHYALAVSPEERARVFIDGDAAGDLDNRGLALNQTHQLMLGGPQLGSHTEAYTGLMDGLAVVGHPLVTAEDQSRLFGLSIDDSFVHVTVGSATAPLAEGDTYTLVEDEALRGDVMQTNWFDTAWQFRRRVDITNTSAQDMVDARVRVTLPTQQLLAQGAAADGTDLRFVSSEGTPLDHVIEAWDPTGESAVWIRIPILATGAAQSAFVYFGNDALVDAQLPQGVWGSDAAVVLHLGSTVDDNSGNGHENTAVEVTDVAGATNLADLAVGRGSMFNGSGSRIAFDTAPGLNNVFQSGGTVVAWIRPASTGEGDYGRIADKADGQDANRGWAFQLSPGGFLRFEHGVGGSARVWTSAQAVQMNEWSHVAVTYDSSSPGTAPKMYIDGLAVAVSGPGVVIGGPASDAPYILTVGNRSGATDRTFDGGIDEFRLYTSARSAQAILDEYRSLHAVTVSALDGVVQRPTLLANDTASTQRTVETVRGPQNGTVTDLLPDGTFTYTPNPDFFGTDSFTYRVISQGLESAPATVTLEVASRPDAPRITHQSGVGVATVQHPENRLAVVQMTATDPDTISNVGSTLTWSIVDNGGTDDAALFTMDPQSGWLSFRALPDYESPQGPSPADNSYQLTVEVSDGTPGGPTARQTLKIDVQNVAEPVVALPDTAIVTGNLSTSVRVLDNDLRPAGRALRLLDVEGDGAAVAGDQILYTPPSGASGERTLSYLASAPTEDGLAHYWRLGDSLQDVMGGANASLLGAPQVINDGVWGSALRFDELDDAVRLPALSYGSEFTLSIWFRVSDNAGVEAQTLFSVGDRGQPNSISVHLREDANPGGARTLRTRLLDADDSPTAENSVDVDVASLIGDGGWHLYTLVVNEGQRPSVYIDGVLAGSRANATGTFALAGEAYLGRSAAPPLESDRLWGGDIDSVSLHTRALSAHEVAAWVTGGTAKGTVTLTIDTPERPVATADAYTLFQGELLTGGAASTGFAADWWNNAWSARQRLNFGSGQTLPSDRAVRVVLDGQQLFRAGAAQDGRDLRFVAADGTALSYVIESWSITGDSVVWVRAPASAPPAALVSHLYVYVGNPSASSEQQANAVWGNNPLLVMSMDTLTDLSGRNTAPEEVQTSLVDGQIASARRFDSNQDRINFATPHSVSNLFASGGTVSAWINPNSTRSAGRIASTGDGTDPTVGWDFRYLNGSLVLETGFNGGWAGWQTSVVIDGNEWTHVAVVLDASQPNPAPVFYVDGRPVGSSRYEEDGGVPSANSPPVAAGQLRDDSGRRLSIGNHSVAGISNTFFPGRIDDVRIFGSALTPTEMEAQAAGAPEVNQRGLIERRRLLSNDNLGGGSSAVLERVTPPSHGEVQLFDNGTFTWTPNTGFSGTDSFTYRIVNQGLASEPVTVSLAVLPAPQPLSMVVGEVPILVPENTTSVRQLTASSSNGTAQADVYTWSLVTASGAGVDHGIFQIDAQTGVLSLREALDYETDDSIKGGRRYEVTVSVSNGRETVTRDLLVDLINVNEGPNAATLDGTTTYMQAITLDPLATSTPGDSGSLPKLLDSERGEIVSGGVRYVPREDQSGVSDSFRYRLIDGSEGLTNYWRLDGNAEDVVGSATGSVTDAVEVISGRYGQAIRFADEGDRVVLGRVDYAPLNWTVGFWFRLDDLSGSGISTLWEQGTGQDRLFIAVGNENNPDTSLRQALRTELSFGNGANRQVLQMDTRLPNGQTWDPSKWYFYTLSMSEAGGTQVRIDGELLASDSRSGPFNPAGGVYLGGSTNGSSDGPGRLRGAMDGAAVWSRALTPAEVLNWAGIAPDRTLGTINVTIGSATPTIVGDLAFAVKESDTDRSVGTVQVTYPTAQRGNLSFRLTGEDAGFFSINAGGAIVWTGPADYEVPPGARSNRLYEFVVQVSDGERSSQRTVTVRLLDVNDNSVTTPADVDARENRISQDSASGTSVGVKISARDADSVNNTVTYALTESAGGLFVINPSTGEVSLNASLLRRSESSYSLVARATSSDTSFAELRFEVVVDKITNQPPSFVTSASIEAPENGDVSLAVNAEDDNWFDPLVYRIVPKTDPVDGVASPDADLFRLGSNQSLLLNFRPDFERPRDANQDNTYEVVVEAFDGELTTRQRITFTVTNVDEAPQWSRPEMTVTNGQVALQIRAKDVDSAPAQLSYGVAEATAGWFALAGSPTVRLSSFTQADVDNGQVIFRLDGTGRTPAFVLTLTDGTHTLESQRALVKVIGSIPVIGAAPAPTPAPAAPPPPAAPSPPRAEAAETRVTTPAPNESQQDTAPSDEESSDDNERVAGLEALLQDRGNGEGASRAVGSRAVQALLTAGSSAASVSPGTGALAVKAAEVAEAAGLLAGWRGPTLTAGDNSSGMRLGYGETAEARTYSALMEAMNRVREEVTGEELEVAVTVGSTALLSGSVSVGYVLWLLRGGVLMATVVSSVPAWAGIDPLPVLRQGRSADDEDGDDADGDRDNDQLERLFSRARKMLKKETAVAADTAPDPSPTRIVRTPLDADKAAELSP